MNLAIHILAAATLFAVIRRTLLSERLRDRFGSAATPLATSCTTIWLAHPLNTQAVTYVVQRAESLMGLCYLATLYCAIRSVQGADCRRWPWVAGAIGVCGAGMLAKEVMITAPLAVLLWLHVYVPPRAPSASIRRGLCTGLGITPAIPVLVALAGDTEGRTALSLAIDPEARSAAAAFSGWTPANYLMTQAGVILHYLRLSIVPSPLIFDYYDWPQARSFWLALPQAALLAAACSVTAAGMARRMPWSFPAAWFFLTLGPTSSVIPIPTEIAAEHRMYLPLAAVVAAVVLLAYAFGRTRGVSRRAGIAAVAAVVIVLGAATRARNVDYGSEQRLWRDTVEKRPGNARARINYGLTLVEEGLYAEAEQQMREAVSFPADPQTAAQALLQLGSALAAQGRFDEGAVHLERALTLDPTAWEAHMIPGQAYSERGELARASAHLKRAIDARPREVLLLNRLTWILATADDPAVRDGARAVELGERALSASGGQNISTLVALAAAYAEAGLFSKAREMASLAIHLARAGGDEQTAATVRIHADSYAAGKALQISSTPKQ